MEIEVKIFKEVEVNFDKKMEMVYVENEKMLVFVELEVMYSIVVKCYVDLDFFDEMVKMV